MTSGHLQRSIGIAGATAMVVGIIIGASIFVQPSVVTARVPSATGVLAAWLAAGALTLLGALVAAELGSAFPRTGGVYVFLSEAYSPALGFLWGWAMFWSMHTAIVAAIAMVLSRYVAHFVPLAPAGLRAVATLAIVAVTAVNLIGVRFGNWVQTTLAAAKVAAVLALAALLLAFGSPGAPTPAAALPAPEPGPALHRLLLAVGAGLFAFGGWHMATYAAEETIGPERTIPRALVLGTLLVTACYVALNAAYLHVLPLEAVAASRSVAADAVGAVLGPRAAAVVAVVVIVSTLGALNGVVLAGPRVYYAMARDRLLFQWLGAVHGRFGTPHRALLLQAAWASVLVATGTYESLFGRVVYTEWLFFALMAVGLVILRSRPAYAPRYRLWGFPAVPLVFAMAALAVALNQIASAPASSLLGLAVIAAGVPAYAITRRARSK